MEYGEVIYKETLYINTRPDGSHVFLDENDSLMRLYLTTKKFEERNQKFKIILGVNSLGKTKIFNCEKYSEADSKLGHYLMYHIKEVDKLTVIISIPTEEIKFSQVWRNLWN